MKNSPSRRRPLVALTGVAALTAVLLTACSSKPPGCADEQTVSLAKEIVLDKWKWLTSERQDEAGKQDIARYTGALKIEIQNIVSDGYNAEARKHSCTGKIVLTSVSGASYSASREFTSQATADGSQKFVVQVEAVEPLVRSLINDLLHYMGNEEAKRIEAKKVEALRQPQVDQPLSVTPFTETKDASPPPQPQPSQETPRVESQGPSFDCAKAATAVERAICGDPKLAELDMAVVNAYNVALSKLPNKQGARTEQGMWIRQVRNACASVQCLVEVYQQRLAQLQ